MNDFKLPAIVFGLVGLIMLAVAAGLAQHEIHIIRTWPETPGTITRSGVGHYMGRTNMYYPDIEARYAVDGREYVSQIPFSYSSSSKSEMREKSEAHPAGSACRLQYDPADPEEIRLAGAFTWGAFFLPLIFGFLGLVMSGLCWPYLAVTWARGRRARYLATQSLTGSL